MPQDAVTGHNTGQWWYPCFWVSIPRTFSSFSCTKWEGKKKKESANWDAQGQVHQTVS